MRVLKQKHVEEFEEFVQRSQIAGIESGYGSSPRNSFYNGPSKQVVGGRET